LGGGMNQKDENLYRRIYQAIKNNKLRLFFAKIKQEKVHGLWYGDCERGTKSKSISIVDPRGLLVATIIHEGLHQIMKDTSEKKIKKIEVRLLKQLTVRRRKNLLKLFIEKSTTTEETVDIENGTTYP
jgi:hypothetical protein